MAEVSSIETEHRSHQSTPGDVCVVRLAIVPEDPVFSEYGRCYYSLEPLFYARIPHDCHQLRPLSHSPNMLYSHYYPHGGTCRALTGPHYCSLPGIISSQSRSLWLVKSPICGRGTPWFYHSLSLSCSLTSQVIILNSGHVLFFPYVILSFFKFF